MKKLHLNIIGYVALLLLAGTLLFQMCSTTNQAMKTIVIDTEFTGEYSIGGSEWKPLDKKTKFSSYDGDLILRGQFSEAIPLYVSFYLNHIGISISVNGEEVFQSGRIDNSLPEMICGSYWSGWIYEGNNSETQLEIRLHNPHSYGNAGAYNQFLDSLHFGAGSSLADHLAKDSMPYQITGIFMLVVSVALLGVALGYFAQRLPSASLLWSMGMMSLFMGGYILMDTVDIEFRSSLMVFNTCVRQFCIMFASLELANCIRKTLAGKQHKAADILVAALGIVNGILLLLSIVGVMDVYDTGLYWAVAQGLVSLVLFVFCIQEYRQDAKENRVLLISYMILLVAVLLELLNVRMNFWTSGIVVKVLFALLFVFHLVRAVILTATNQRESVRAKELAGELRNSRIVLAMSQIRTHFIFNVLTAISGMCEYDPEQADATLIRFSRYLRSNIDIMEEDKLELFSKSLEHLEDYIALEQIRFGSKIQFVKNLEVTNFMIPPLILQPIVENAIKHGLLPKTSGGTIGLYTQTDGKNIIITITDDGVGFDTANMKKEGSVGLNNVRFRLTHMVNGRLEVESSVGNGTKVTITMPCS